MGTVDGGSAWNTGEILGLVKSGGGQRGLEEGTRGQSVREPVTLLFFLSRPLSVQQLPAAWFSLPSCPFLRMWPSFPLLPTSCPSWLPHGSPAASSLLEGWLPVRTVSLVWVFLPCVLFLPLRPFWPLLESPVPPTISKTWCSPASSFPNSGPLEY